MSDVLDFIRDDRLAGGIHVYPNAPDDNNKRIYQECLRLEAAGKIERKIDEPNHIFFRGVDDERSRNQPREHAGS